jgi:hypothetical protein
MVVRVYNPSTLDEFEAILMYIERPCLKRKKGKNEMRGTPGQ